MFKVVKQSTEYALCTALQTNCDSISVVDDRYDTDPSKLLTLEQRLKRDNSAGLSKTQHHQDAASNGTHKKDI